MAWRSGRPSARHFDDAIPRVLCTNLSAVYCMGWGLVFLGVGVEDDKVQ